MGKMSELWYERKTIMDANGYHLPVAIQEAMTLRDQFAMVAIQGSVGKLPYDYEKRDEYIKNLAVGAYMIADAMMEERKWLPEEQEK